MSHLDKIDLKIRDIEAATATAKELGGELVQQSTYRWYGHHVGDYPFPEGFKEEDLGKCEYAIKVPGTTWEIGLAKRKGDDHYTMLFDFYGSQGAVLEKYLGGKQGNRFKQSYTMNAAQLEAKRKGYLCQRKTVGTKQQLIINVP